MIADFYGNLDAILQCKNLLVCYPGYVYVSIYTYKC